MTTNERLFVAGLLAAYDKAVASGDAKSIDGILAQVSLRRDSEGKIRSVANDA